MFTHLFALLMAFAIIFNPAESRVLTRDKTGTIADQAKKESSQLLGVQEVASFGVSPAEDKGFEPSTGYPALDFESSC